ncbi:unnamed protein product, partial [Penicillium discolor]
PATERGETAADDHRLDVGREHEHAHGRRGPEEQVRLQGEGVRIARVGCRHDVLDRERAGASPGLGQRPAAAERLHAAALSAAAQTPAGVDGEVPDLARGPPRPAPDAAVDDDAGRDAGAQVQVGHRSGDVAQDGGAERGRLHVVLHPERDAQRLLGARREVEGFHAEVHGVQHTPGLRLHEAGDADAGGSDGGQRQPALLGERGDGRDDAVDDGVLSPPGRAAEAGEDRPRRVDGDGVDLRAAHVEAHAKGPTGALPGEHHHRGAPEHDVVLAGEPHHDVLEDALERAGVERLDGGVDERAVQQLGGSGEHDLGQIEGGDDRGDRDRHAGSGVAEDLLARGRVGVERLMHAAHAQPGLQAADLAARAARAAVRADDDVTDLPRRETAAEERLAAGDEPGTHAAADLDQHEVGFRLAERVLREHGGVGVVARQHGEVELGAELGLQREVGPAEVGRAEDEAVRAHDTRGADADAEHRLRGDLDEGLREAAEGVVGGIAVGRRGTRNLTPLQHVAVEAEHGALEGGRTGQVESDDLMPHAVDVDEDRRLTGAHRLADADLDDDAVGDELRDEVGDRDAREAGLAGEVGAAHRPRVIERLQHEGAVVTARVLGEHLGARTEMPRGAEGVRVRGDEVCRRRGALIIRNGHVC